MTSVTIGLDVRDRYSRMCVLDSKGRVMEEGRVRTRRRRSRAPRRNGSRGTRTLELRITKAGDKMLRRLLVGSAHYILGPFGPDTELRRWGLKLAGRGGPHGNKKAAVAVARKLAVVLHRLWLSGDEYEPLRAPVEVSAA